MAVTIKDLAAAVGVEVEDENTLTVEDFTAKVSEKYILKEAALKDEDLRSKMVGKTLGAATTKAAQILGLKASEYEGKKIEEVIELGASKLTGEIERLKVDGGKPNDKKIDDLTKKLGELEGVIQMKESGLTTLQAQLDEVTQASHKKLKDYKLNDKKNKVLGTLADKFSDDFNKNELVKVGFNSYFDNEYELDLDDKEEEIIVKRKKDGSLVQSKSKAGHAATFNEILLAEAEAKGVLKKNNGGTQTTVVRTQADAAVGAGGVKVHPNALAKAKR
jgi:hypothetical protein